MLNYVLANQKILNDHRKEISEWSDCFLDLLEYYKDCPTLEVWFNIQNNEVKNYVLYNSGIVVAFDTKRY